MNNHLSPQQMLGYVDGELSKPETRRAQEHLHSCWTCLTELERLKEDIATILDAQNESFTPALPPPRQPWPGFRMVLVRSLPKQGWLRVGCDPRLRSLLNPIPVVAVSGFVAALLVCGYAMFRSKPVSAKEVLRRIQIADMQRSAITKDQVIRERVHVRKMARGQSHAKLASVDAWKSPTATYWNVSDGDSPAADLRVQYQAHDIPLSLPLSAASVDSWGKAAGSSPTVSEQGSQVDLSFSGSRDSAKGPVERVSVAVAPDTWQVKQMTLDFPDASFEITEDDYSVIPTSDVPADLLARLEPPAQPTVQPLSRLSAASIHASMVNLDKAELGVFTTLHRLRADLGEPVTVTRTSRAIQIGVWQLPVERKDELRAAFSDKAGVEVELTSPHVVGNRAAAGLAQAPPTTSSAVTHVEAGASEDQRLLNFFGSPEREQDFTNEALGTSTAILSHLYALRNLQQQFPVDRSQLLAPEEQGQLRSLVQDHVTAISANVDALDRQLSPLEASFTVPSCASFAPATGTSWQAGSLEALQTGKGIDHNLRTLLTSSQATTAPASALPEIAQNLCRLRAEMRSLVAAGY